MDYTSAPGRAMGGWTSHPSGWFPFGKAQVPRGATTIPNSVARHHSNTVQLAFIAMAQPADCSPVTHLVGRIAPAAFALELRR
ncbi:hypothetical protein IWX88_000290 [Frigoribacterium sp. CG_9.8]|nr:hypothetical protein [Frigoribacterium sp. CG_9.8]